MRGVVILATLLGGCSFSVGGVDVPATPGGAPGGIGGAGPAAPVPLADGGLASSGGPDLSRVPLGAPCSDDTQCGGMQCVHGVPGFPQGYCTVLCGDHDPKCPMGSACADVGDGLKVCLACAGPCGGKD